MAKTAADTQAPADVSTDDTKTGTPADAGKPAPKADEKPAAGAGDDEGQDNKPVADAGKKKPDATTGKEAPAEPAKGKDGPPEKYALTVPEGAEAYLDAEDLKAIEKTARAQGWTNDVAQTAIEEHADALAAQSAAFRAITETDKTYGGDNLAETQRLASTVLDKFAPVGDPLGDALRRDLAKTGYGNKLSVLSFLTRIGKAIAEDTPGQTSGLGGSKKKPKTPEELFYAD